MNECYNCTVVFSRKYQDVRNFVRFLNANKDNSLSSYLHYAGVDNSDLECKGFLCLSKPQLGDIHSYNDGYFVRFSTVKYSSSDNLIWKKILEKLNNDKELSLDCVTISEEPGMEYYVNTDTKHVFFEEMYCVDIDMYLEFFKSEVHICEKVCSFEELKEVLHPLEIDFTDCETEEEIREKIIGKYPDNDKDISIVKYSRMP